MHVLRDAESIHEAALSFPDPRIRKLIASRVEFLSDCEGEDPEIDELVNFIVIESGDTLQSIDAALGFKLLVNPYSGKRFGQPAFVPSFETLEEHPSCYEMTFIVGDGGFAEVVLVPKGPDIDPEVLSLCARHATPAMESSP